MVYIGTSVQTSLMSNGKLLFGQSVQEKLWKNNVSSKH